MVGTTTGAVAFDENFKKPEDVQFYHFSRMPNDTQSLSNNDVHWIISTKKKELYLATFGGGLNKLISISKDGHGEFKPIPFSVTKIGRWYLSYTFLKVYLNQPDLQPIRTVFFPHTDFPPDDIPPVLPT